MNEIKEKIEVFYVEDEPDLVELCRIVFKGAGIEMRSFSTGEEAMRALVEISAGKAAKPDVFILDILLPGISGMDILHEIRGNVMYDETPIIIFTNYSDAKIKAEAEQTKKCEYILKTNIVPSQLAEIVKNRIGAK